MHDGQVYYIPHLGMQEISDPGIVLGQTSNWSNIETINLADNSVSISTSASPNPTPTLTQNSTPTPTVPEVSSWAIPLLLTIMLASAGLLVYYKKHKR